MVFMLVCASIRVGMKMPIGGDSQITRVIMLASRYDNILCRVSYGKITWNGGD